MSGAAVRSVALGEQLAGVLRGRIVRGEIPPGTHLVEDALANRHDVSRGPVRDALRTLLAEGLLESRRRGYYSKEFAQADIDELYEIRVAAEQLAGRLAIRNAEAADWQAASALLDDMRGFAAADQQHAYARADLDFHTQFYVLSGNSRLLAMWQQYQPTFDTLLSITNAQDADLRPSWGDHRKLLELAEAGREADFAAELDSHLAGSHRRLSAAVHGQVSGR